MALFGSGVSVPDVLVLFQRKAFHIQFSWCAETHKSSKNFYWIFLFMHMPLAIVKDSRMKVKTKTTAIRVKRGRSKTKYHLCRERNAWWHAICVDFVTLVLIFFESHAFGCICIRFSSIKMHFVIQINIIQPFLFLEKKICHFLFIENSPLLQLSFNILHICALYFALAQKMQ